MGLVLVAGVGETVGFGTGELFEDGILDGGGDLVISTGPFAEVQQAATVGAEGEVLVSS